MITLDQAASFFNSTTVTDIDGLNPFYAQFLPFDDAKRSGSTSRRRIMEVAPDVTVPTVVIDSLSGQVYLTAIPSEDSFDGYAIREKYPVIPSDHAYTLLSPYDLLAQTAVSSIRANVTYIRREGVEDNITDLGGFLVVLPRSVSATAGQFIYTGSDYYRALEDSYEDPIGMPSFNSVRVPDAVQNLSVTTGQTYDPVTETNTGGSTTSVRCIVEDREKSFEMRRADAADNMKGDVTISTLQIFGDDDTISLYNIISKRVEGSVTIIHGRPK